MQVFLTTNPFSEKQPQYSATAQAALATPTNHTPTLISAALKLLREIYRTGHRYKKTGIFVTELIAESDRQRDLFEDVEATNRHKRLDSVVDQLNRKLGSNAIRYGSMGTQQKWAMRQEKRSQSFTTRWAELPVANV